jgi:hypothetical protein
VTASVGKYKQEQVNHPIYNGCPIERRGPPVVIYNEPLARLTYLLFAGAILVEVFSVQNFTGYIYTGGDPFESRTEFLLPSLALSPEFTLSC